MSRFDHAAYVSLTMEFRCNLRCVHCMIEGTMDRLAPESDGHFEAVLAHNARERCWTGLILTGSEITLRRDLPDLARRARASGFSHVRIQTHGMHLGQPSYCRRLVEAGIDEFFVSIAGSDAASHDGLTLVPGSFERALRGLETLDGMEGVATLTNTVVTERSYRLLPGIVARLAHLRRLAQMEFWLYFPMAEEDEKGLIARHTEVLPYLREAVLAARALGRAVEVKNFPHCLLGDLGDALVNAQPELHIDPRFWSEFERNGFYQCVHRDACGSRDCLGLNTAYIRKFGTEAEALRPLPITPPSRSTTP
ncbi:radical SAM protein [Methylobacterium currus]|uniref:radical SAM protein n=1 Tax=Methylobacterium currus TaxID=2051553 RepID=UPI001E372163|nr:radical SAM protein [Methylobacterium currus]UHC18627.1 radical SAM protein [Methylobacterium currus]